jgi:hypothetical protein
MIAIALLLTLVATPASAGPLTGLVAFVLSPGPLMVITVVCIAAALRRGPR